MKKRWMLTLAAAVLAAAAAAACLLHRALLPPLWVRWQTAERTASDDNAQRIVLTLEKKRVQVMQNGENLWQSDHGVLVQDMLWCDIDHDGEEELMLLCWRRGRYGPSRPFWVTEDEKGWSQHIFIYDWTGQDMKPIWMASDIGLDAVSWRFDEKERLVITGRDGAESRWDWISWGLSALQ